MQISSVMRRAMLDSFIETIGAGATLGIYSGTMPDIEEPISDQTELVVLPLANPPFVRDMFENKALINVSSYPNPFEGGEPTFFVIYSASEGAMLIGEVVTGATTSIPNKLVMEGTEIVEGEPVQSVLLTVRY